MSKGENEMRSADGEAERQFGYSCNTGTGSLSGTYMRPIEVVAYCERSYEEQHIRVNEVEAAVFQDPRGFAVVVFRGTEGGQLISGNGWVDVLRDLRVVPWYDRRVGWSHAGFLKGAQGVVDRGLYGLLRRDQYIVCLGHSMGGAVALNAAALLEAEEFNVLACYTIGSPRTLTKGARKRFRKLSVDVRQYSNPGDPICDVPFRWWGYRHLKEIHTDREADGYSIANNHLVGHYRQAFEGRARLQDIAQRAAEDR